MTRGAGRVGTVEVVTGWSLAGALVLVGAVRAGGSERHRFLVGVQGVARWLLLPAHPLAAWAGWRRRPVLTAVALTLAGAQIALVRGASGRHRGETAPAGAARVRLLTTNLLLTNPEVAQLGDQVRAVAADVVALQELTPEHLGELRRTGLLGLYPHQQLDPQPGYHGTGLLSRFPIASGRVVDVAGTPLLEAELELPGTRLRLVVVHAVNPGAPGGLTRWQEQLQHLAALVSRSGHPLVLAGDFNATLDHRSLRLVLRSGLRDAFAVAGRGLGLTWPVWRGPVPSVMRLDHVLVGPGVAVLGLRTAAAAGSDHRLLVADLAVTARPQTPDRPPNDRTVSPYGTGI